jgi:L-histidine N-alpha-methyltransferase
MIDKEFLEEVNTGLSKKNKTLPSRYFYDAKGDDLFVKIMNSPEYYLTDSEHEIMREQTREIIAASGMGKKPFRLIELGAGDGTKTIELLRELSGQCAFTYMPIDISKNALKRLKERIKNELPGVSVEPKQGEYFAVLEDLHTINEPMFILFLGSNLGNMLDDRAHTFIQHLADVMNQHDMLLVGLDLKKDPAIILPAYNDAQGYTRDFNLNLLDRINAEFDANFDANAFSHAPMYDAENGLALSYLKSLKDQDVHISALNKTFHFQKGERIHTEISRKYDDDILKGIIKETGLEIEHVFTDSKNYFADYLLIKA